MWFDQLPDFREEMRAKYLKSIVDALASYRGQASELLYQTSVDSLDTSTPFFTHLKRKIDTGEALDPKNTEILALVLKLVAHMIEQR